MPTYTIQNKETGEEKDVVMRSFSEFEDFLAQNPQYKQVFRKFPGYCDPVRLGGGLRKIDDGFNDVLKGIKKSNWGANINTK